MYGLHFTSSSLQNEGLDSGAGVRLYDYHRMGEIAASIPMIAERIQFVNPHERDWTRFERKWHR